MADGRKVKAIYTMIEAEIQGASDIWTDEFLDELNKRSADLESGKVKGYTWEEVKARAKKKLHKTSSDEPECPTRLYFIHWLIKNSTIR